ncbi:DISARM system helicase DrmA [Ornithinimicrobium cryptoxanthini]|uniref:DISARM system helicase DrmA n=1 Tax=Ornithinimicrobium cryptoxanthini TaxID=2934161 RepID=UPI002118A28C|nr:DISARM system helicase DrmA [Ornithinimicrobium cryptoxanthini]
MTAAATPAAGPLGRPRPTYDLGWEPDGRSWTVRENLADILERELLGPSRGPEELMESPPDITYLVGRIAPAKLTDGTDDPSGAEGEEPIDVGGAEEAHAGRGVPVTDVDDTTAESDEDNVEDQPQQRGLMIPASMGLRFQVPFDLEAFTVAATWGVYNPVSTGEVTKSGRLIRHFQRTPVEHQVTVPISDLVPGTTASYVLQDQVTLRVDRFDDEHGGRRLIEIALCNDRETPRKIPVNAWLFQTKLTVDAAGQDAFLPVRDALEDDTFEHDDEVRRLALQYRDRLEFAIGRTCSADWRAKDDARRAYEVSTTWLPTSETPQTTAKEISDAELDMQVLATADAATVRAGLSPIVDGYGAWLDSEQERTHTLPRHLQDEAEDAIHEARRVHQQLAEGFGHLTSDDEALRCFQFMNRVMADQRIQTQVAERRAQDPCLSRTAARDWVLARTDVPPHSWRTFQLAFILMQLPALTDPATDRRSSPKATARAELLFFPTGGGKTEAYLGLAAYTFAIRRRQGRIDTPDGPLDGHGGVAVLMRYTLRLLTSQQFQRATALVCAAEMARREDEGTWGTEPFRIGLWVGTDVSPKRFDEAAEQLGKVNRGLGHRLTVLQIQRCPWCGTKITPADVRADEADRRVHVYCGDDLAECPFSDGGAAGEGLPVLTVDEEIYRLAPAFVIATVDKFARLAREGEAATLFGYVSRRCDRHGYVHPDYKKCDLKDGSKHPAKNGVPAAAVHPATRLRPPDLIIQDELHLITGALGTTVGLFEVAIETLASWQTPDGRPVRPMIVASTATVRNAADQVRGLYGRGVTIFPPQVLNVEDTFFSREEPVTESTPGRRYLGISTTGVRLTTAEIRVAEVLMAGAQLLMDRSGSAADPYMSLVSYFNATRELAGMARYMGDDIQTLLAKGRPWTGLPRRTGTAYGELNVAELTSRVSSADITTTLDQMAVPFDPEFDSTDGKARRRAQVEAGEEPSKRSVNPFDTVLATSMLQVGVDVTRLGLILLVGQPKNTAEYIQASSRVGRDANRPGLVVALGNWARPRDLAHFEQFRHYHETFYSQVESLSVTPFSITSVERGVDGLLVSAARVFDATRRDGLSPEKRAGKIEAERALVDDLVDRLSERARRAGGEDAEKLIRARLLNRLDHWLKRRDLLLKESKSLVYEKVTQDGEGPLMRSAEDAKGGLSSGVPFTVANSMREVQPEINLLVSPIPERLFLTPRSTDPQWRMPVEVEGEL